MSGCFAKLATLLVLIWVVLGAAACSVPTLETPECTEARDIAKRFYSAHFGGSETGTGKVDLRLSLLTPEFADEVSRSTVSGDIFTTGDNDKPKAFRIGQCRESTADRASVQVIFFWRDDNRSEQKEITVETVKRDGRWLINKILYSNK